MKPIYFNVVVWGDGFRGHFVDYCIPSLLAAGNLPALTGGRDNKFLICTTRPDWQAMGETASFRAMAEYVDPVFMEIPYPEPGVSGPQHMGGGHRMATERMFRDKVYGCLLTPDVIVSDGSLATLQRLAAEGMRLVIATSIRSMEEKFFRSLADGGFVPVDGRLSETGAPLTISGRQLVELNVPALHSETQAWEWDAPYYSHFPVGAWWRVPGDQGVLFYTLSWAPVLVDYAGIDSHDAAMMVTGTIDRDYIDRNFKGYEEVYAVQDTDEFNFTSWAPADDRPVSLSVKPIKSYQRHAEVIKGLTIRRTFNHPIFDEFKRQRFLSPVRFHAGDLGTNWEKTEGETRRLLGKYTKRMTAWNMPEVLGWYAEFLVAAVQAWETYVTLALWIAIRLYRPVINRDISLSYVHANRDDLLARLKKRITGGADSPVSR